LGELIPAEFLPVPNFDQVLPVPIFPEARMLPVLKSLKSKLQKVGNLND